jgi:hypothetical protein
MAIHIRRREFIFTLGGAAAVAAGLVDSLARPCGHFRSDVLSQQEKQ